MKILLLRWVYLYRQIVGRMFTDGLITKDERDNAFAQVDQMQKDIAAKSNQKQ